MKTPSSTQQTMLRKYAQAFKTYTPRQIADDAQVQFTPFVASIIAEARR